MSEDGASNSGEPSEELPEIFLSEVEEEYCRAAPDAPASERNKQIEKSQTQYSLASAVGGVKIKKVKNTEEQPAVEPNETVTSAVEDEDLESEWKRRIEQIKASKSVAAADESVKAKKVESSTEPHREDFTLMEALAKSDFWLIFFSLLLGSGSGLTVIDNLGQMSESFGYGNAHIFVSMVSIWNFLGRVSGGFLSEIIVRDHAYPKPIALIVAQVVLVIGQFIFATGWAGSMHIGTMLVGLGYGAHWAIVPATVSELFGLKNFGAMYNFITVANPTGSLIFSAFITSVIYDYEAEKQANAHRNSFLSLRRFLSSTGSLADEPLKCKGTICFFFSSLVMSGFCVVAVMLSLFLVFRNKSIYAKLYGK